MARGEAGKEGPRGPGLAIASSFGVLCLAALTCVLSSTRACDGCMPRGWLTPPVPTEPFAGALVAFDDLHWRDTGRARGTYVRPSAPDASAAALALESELTERGYVRASVAPTSTIDLPADVITVGLDGACGVVAITGLGNATIDAVDGPDGRVRASDPSAIAIAACGDARMRALGTGSATVEVWHLPGITPADVLGTGLSAEVVLAHAEAERLWRARGLAPADQVVRDERSAGSVPTFVGPPGAPPARGCVAWVGVAIGAGTADTTSAYAALGRDYAIDRGLFGGASCATIASPQTMVTDPDGDGFVVYWRPYGQTAGGAGPARPSEGGASAPSAGAMRMVEAGAIVLPEALPERAAP